MAPHTRSSCGHRGCLVPGQERLLTGATMVTFGRTALSLGLALYGAFAHSLAWLLAALLAYWIGDIADGALARLTDSETRIGAAFDIICDRLCAVTFYVGLAWIYPGMSVAVGVYLFQFAVVDTFLSLGFLAWPLVSPNYFYRVDVMIWRLNWSKIGKTLNSSLFAVLLLLTHSVTLGIVIGCGLLALKVWSLVRLMRIGLPVPTGCAESRARTADGESIGHPAT